ncbi:MAG: prolipoprotein diacylglyceryl transferase family protein [Thermodesulfobacteriota bacterium]
MTHSVFILAILFFLFFLFRWAFRALPMEHWQIIGVLPTQKDPDGRWIGINLTYYGFFIATAYLVATSFVFVLLGALSISAGVTTLLFLFICLPAVPSSRVIARIVEKKPHTASIGAASFVGIILAPWAVLLVKGLAGLFSDSAIAVLPTLSALIIAYTFGEGLGRLACISFGCCYGKPMKHIPAILRRIPGIRPVVYSGATKKISYADHLDGEETFPIQAITAVLYCGIGVLGIHLFVGEHFTAAFMLLLIVTQIWRFLSEFLRADYRGDTLISAYQIMALITVPYGWFITAVFPGAPIGNLDLLQGISILWKPLMLVFLQGLWLAMFWYNGRSHTTGATLHFHVNYDKI